MRAELRLWLRRGIAAVLTAVLFLALCLTASAASATETPTETPVETLAETPEASPEATPEASPTPTAAPEESPTETPEASPTPTATPAASPEASPAPTAAPEAEEKSETLPVYIDGLLYARAMAEDGAVFIAPDCVCRFLGYSMDWTADAKKLRLSVQGVELTADADAEYMTAAGRYLYEPEGWLEVGGELYLPADAIERLFGLEIEEKASPRRIEIDTQNAALIAGGEAYYELNYRCRRI